MNAATFARRPRRHVAAGLAGLAVLTIAATARPQAPPKRPLKHSDYDAWNTASGMTISRDGTWSAYVVTPAEGDGVVVVKSLTMPAEFKVPRGGRPRDDVPPGPARAGGRPGAGRAGLAGGPQFTPDGKRVVFPIPPTKAELDKARGGRNSDDGPRSALVVMELPTGRIVERLPRVQSFGIHAEGSGFLVYKKEPPPADSPPPAAAGAIVGGPAAQPVPAGPPGPGGRTTRRPGAGVPPAATPAPPRPEYGTELVARNLADGTERTFADVTEFAVTKDGKLLVFAVAAKKDDANGVYAVSLDSQAGQFPLKAGKGKYTRLTWDEKQTRFVFFHDDTRPRQSVEATAAVTGTPAAQSPSRGSSPVASPPPPAKLHVYLWERDAKAATAGGSPVRRGETFVSTTAARNSEAVEILGPATPGLKPGWLLSDRAAPGFSPDGLKLSVSTTPEPRDPQVAQAGAPVEDKVELDIWHWKDEYIQPMQKVRAEADRNRTYSAVYLIDTKEFHHLSDEAWTVPVPDFGDWAVGSSDKPYRHLIGYGPNLNDYALVNVRTGERKELFKAHERPVFSSSRGRYIASFDGRDWVCLSVPDGKVMNLTAKLPVKFYDEEFDSPSEPPPYDIPAWSADEKYVLLADRYDVWKVAVDGSSATNLTRIGRPQKIRFRRVRPAEADPEPERGIDLTKPLLFRAVNQETWDTGYYRLDPAGPPKLLVMGARNYGLPIKAKAADVYLLTVGSFFDYPDYFATTPDFREVKRVTDVNPRKAEFNWGRAELVHYKSLDGTPLSGMLIKPEDFDPAKKYPMIVYIYERLSSGLHDFRAPAAGTSINPTYYASNGYLVLMPDIAYTVGAPGQSALKCVLPAIQAVVDQGCVDEGAIGIQGHSWGGYQIAYMVTQTNRFKAAAAGAPVSDMVSAYGGIRWGTGLPREFQYERTQSRIGATLWQAPLKFIENSPVFMADRVRTPLLMLHNDQDDAVPWYQGIEYYLALRRLGKEAYLLNYNGELHGLRKRANQKDYTLRMQQFFDHHLKGAPMPEWMAKGVTYLDREKEKEQWKGVYVPARARK